MEMLSAWGFTILPIERHPSGMPLAEGGEGILLRSATALEETGTFARAVRITGATYLAARIELRKLARDRFAPTALLDHLVGAPR